MTHEQLSDIHLQLTYWRYMQLRAQGATGNVAERALYETAPEAIRLYRMGYPQRPSQRRWPPRWLRRTR